MCCDSLDPLLRLAYTENYLGPALLPMIIGDCLTSWSCGPLTCTALWKRLLMMQQNRHGILSGRGKGAWCALQISWSEYTSKSSWASSDSAGCPAAVRASAEIAAKPPLCSFTCNSLSSDLYKSRQQHHSFLNFLQSVPAHRFALRH